MSIMEEVSHEAGSKPGDRISWCLMRVLGDTAALQKEGIFMWLVELGCIDRTDRTLRNPETRIRYSSRTFDYLPYA